MSESQNESFEHLRKAVAVVFADPDGALRAIGESIAVFGDEETAARLTVGPERFGEVISKKEEDVEAVVAASEAFARTSRGGASQ